ncbi:UNVERIFIED_CONTAM: ATP-dependent helicase HRQ1 [Sesamum angustifolium]|uniref:ATP-dependent helicase HRQ1 n=1 Tax=Sesamum angustifolium TaxID=2727405 RepID=A0AAW2LJI0_9LAMI
MNIFGVPCRQYFRGICNVFLVACACSWIIKYVLMQNMIRQRSNGCVHSLTQSSRDYSAIVFHSFIWGAMVIAEAIRGILRLLIFLIGQDTKTLLPEEMTEHLRSSIGSQGQVVHIEEIGARNAKYVEIPCQLSQNVRSALNRVGITRLYSHQAESIQASLAGKNVIVATMTSSGKSLCYNIPVLEVLLHNPLACALYLFPTKALAQDQLRALSAITHGLDDSLNIGIYDGDTHQEDRLWLQDNARLVFYIILSWIRRIL